ncbi:class I SAM-dependent methyltransferase [Luteipulveratus halotolerans]|uniref:class I SAM-dependent methyltransferase n=1 Tax=Luteipulveratus halotolerans TaxID=1631356 RepID=UPI0006819B92|nr:class I SAM-dependent methyltransferase [Luteipulveratus halotolerans]
MDGRQQAQRDATIASYQEGAQEYRAATESGLRSPLADAAGQYARTLSPGARVLEIGSGTGRDARELESLGLSVRRPDITPAFVEMMRADGYTADVLDPLTDDLGGPYDGVWASAVLVHLTREETDVVLRRLATVTRPSGRLFASLKEGDGRRRAQAATCRESASSRTGVLSRCAPR